MIYQLIDNLRILNCYYEKWVELHKCLNKERKGYHATYISLMKFTGQGVKNVKEAPKRIEQLIKGLEALGGKLIALYLTMGEYDYIGIAEAPSDEVAVTFLMTMGTAGNVKTTTLKADTLEEFAGIVKKLP